MLKDVLRSPVFSVIQHNIKGYFLGIISKLIVGCFLTIFVRF